MKTENSQPQEMIRPEAFLEELGIGKDTYYRDLKYLQIEPQKDSEGRAYLTLEQSEQLRALRNHVEEKGKRNGFESSSIVKQDNSQAAVSVDSIYVEPEEPTANVDINNLLRNAAQLKARDLAMRDLITRKLADEMSEEDLPPDLQEKVRLAREAANPKFTPQEVATSLLAQWRAKRNNG